MKLDNVIAVRKNKKVYRDGDLCIKVFDEDYSKADVLNEALNQARIEETGLNIPKIKEVMMIDGKWAIVLEYIEGKTLSKLMEENPDKKAEYLELLVDLQLEMHQKTCPMLNKLKDKMSRKIDQTTLDATTRYAQQGDELTAVGIIVFYGGFNTFCGYFEAQAQENPSSVYGYTLVSVEEISGNQDLTDLTATASSVLENSSNYDGEA